MTTRKQTDDAWSKLSRVELCVDQALGYLLNAQEELLLEDPVHNAIGGGLSVLETGLRAISEVIEHHLVQTQQQGGDH